MVVALRRRQSVGAQQRWELPGNPSGRTTTDEIVDDVTTVEIGRTTQAQGIQRQRGSREESPPSKDTFTIQPVRGTLIRTSRPPRR